MPNRRNPNQRAFIDPVSIIGVSFLFIVLTIATIVVNDPLRKQLISSYAKEKSNFQNYADSLIRQRERSGKCKGSGCLAEEVIKNRNSQGDNSTAQKSAQTEAEQKIIDTFDKARAGDLNALSELRKSNSNLADQVQKELDLKAKESNEVKTPANQNGLAVNQENNIPSNTPPTTNQIPPTEQKTSPLGGIKASMGSQLNVNSTIQKPKYESQSECEKSNNPYSPEFRSCNKYATTNENRKNVIESLTKISSKFASAFNNSDYSGLEGLGTYGLGDGNITPALPQSAVTSSQGYYDYAKGTLYSGAAGFAAGVPAAELTTAPFGIWALAGGTLSNVPAAAAIYTSGSFITGISPTLSALTATYITAGAIDCGLNGSESKLCRNTGDMAITGYTADPVSFTQMFVQAEKVYRDTAIVLGSIRPIGLNQYSPNALTDSVDDTADMIVTLSNGTRYSIPNTADDVVSTAFSDLQTSANSSTALANDLATINSTSLTANSSTEMLFSPTYQNSFNQIFPSIFQEGGVLNGLNILNNVNPVINNNSFITQENGGMGFPPGHNFTQPNKTSVALANWANNNGINVGFPDVTISNISEKLTNSVSNFILKNVTPAPLDTGVLTSTPNVTNDLEVALENTSNNLSTENSKSLLSEEAKQQPTLEQIITTNIIQPIVNIFNRTSQPTLTNLDTVSNSIASEVIIVEPIFPRPSSKSIQILNKIFGIKNGSRLVFDPAKDIVFSNFLNESKKYVNKYLGGTYDVAELSRKFVTDAFPKYNLGDSESGNDVKNWVDSVYERGDLLNENTLIGKFISSGCAVCKEQAMILHTVLALNGIESVITSGAKPVQPTLTPDESKPMINNFEVDNDPPQVNLAENPEMDTQTKNDLAEIVQQIKDKTPEEIAQIILETKLKSIKDPLLTQLFNKGFLKEALQIEVDISKRNMTSLSVASGDLNNFKSINDNRGHLDGDNALKIMEDIITKVTRTTDIKIRAGGDEFVIIFPNTTQEEADIVMRKILDEISRRKNIASDGEVIHEINFSYGIKEWNNKDDVDQFLNNLDKEMYEAKRGSKQAQPQSSNPSLIKKFSEQLYSFYQQKIIGPIRQVSEQKLIPIEKIGLFDKVTKQFDQKIDSGATAFNTNRLMLNILKKTENWNQFTYKPFNKIILGSIAAGIVIVDKKLDESGHTGINEYILDVIQNIFKLYSNPTVETFINFGKPSKSRTIDETQSSNINSDDNTPTSSSIDTGINTNDTIVKTQKLFNDKAIYTQYQAEDSRNITYHVIRVDLDNAEFFVTPHQERTTTSYFLSENNLDIAINGDGWKYFTDDYGIVHLETIGLSASNGQTYGLGKEQTIYFGKDNSIQIAPDKKPDEIWNAISFPNMLIQDGIVVPHPDKVDINPRTALGVTNTGVLILVTVDGSEYQSGMYVEELTKLLQEQGATDAVMFDSGTSSTMSIKGPDGNPITINNPTCDTYTGECQVANQLGIRIKP